jgi:hypothetical protein
MAGLAKQSIALHEVRRDCFVTGGCHCAKLPGGPWNDEEAKGILLRLPEVASHDVVPK